MRTYSKSLLTDFWQKHQINIWYQRFSTLSLIFHTVQKLMTCSIQADTPSRFSRWFLQTLFHCVNVVVILVDLGLPLCPLFTLVTRPLSLNFRRHLIVSLLAGFLPGKSIVNCCWMWVDSKYTLFCINNF